MKYKRMMLAALVLLAILTMGAVCASDGADNLAAADVGADELEISDALQSDEILNHEGDSVAVGDGARVHDDASDITVEINANETFVDDYDAELVYVKAPKEAYNRIKITNDGEGVFDLNMEDIQRDSDADYEYYHILLNDIWEWQTPGQHDVTVDIYNETSGSTVVSLTGTVNIVTNVLPSVSFRDNVDVYNKYEDVVSYWIDDQVPGYIAVIFDGQVIYNRTVFNSYEELTVKDLNLYGHDFGSYEIEFVYSGNKYYKGYSKSSNINLTYNFDLYFDYEGDYFAIYGEPMSYRISTPDDEDENAKIIFTINGKQYTLDHNVVEVDLDDVVYGLNNVTFTYVSKNYPSRTINHSFICKSVAIIPNTVKFNETLDFTLKLPKDADGVLNVYELIKGWEDGGFTYVYELKSLAACKAENGTVNVSISNLSMGSHYIYVNFTGNYDVEIDGWVTNPESEEYDVITKVIPILEVPKQVWINGNATAIFKAPENYNGNLTVSIGFEDRVFKVTNGSASFDLYNLDFDDWGDGDNYRLNIYYEYVDEEIDVSASTFTRVSRQSPEFELKLLDGYDNQSIVKGDIYYVAFDMPDYCGGNITAYIDDEFFGIYSAGECGVDIDVGNLSMGKHDVRFEYTGDDYFNPATAYASFDITFITYSIPQKVTLQPNPEYMVYDNHAYFVFSENATGEVKLVVDGVDIETKNVRHDEAVFDLTNLTYGNHTVTFIYQNGNWPSKNITANVEAVYKYIFGCDGIPYGRGIFWSILPPGATGVVTVTIDGKQFNATIDEKGIATHNITGVLAGEYDTLISYAGDGKYPPYSESFICIIEYSVLFNFDSYDMYVEDLANNSFILILPENATGKFVLKKWDNDALDFVELRNVSMVDGKAEIFLDCLSDSIGYNELCLDYVGDDYFVYTRYADIDVQDYQLVCLDDQYNITLGDNVTYMLKLPENLTGYLNVYGDEDYKKLICEKIQIENNSAKISFKPLTLGYQSIEFKYIGSDYYYECTEYIEVKLHNTTLKDEVYGDDVLFTVIMPEDAAGNLTLYICDDPQYDMFTVNATYHGSVAEVMACEIPVGNWTLYNFVVDDKKYGKFNYELTNEFIALQHYGVFKVNPLDSNLTVFAKDIGVGETAVIEIAINRDASGNVTVNGENVRIANGSAKYEIRNLAAGNHTYTVSFAGDAKFHADEKTVEIMVYKLEAPEIAIDVESSVVEGSDLAVGITVENATGIVNINGENMSLADGKASTVIKNVTVGDLDVNVFYFGSDKYLNASGYAKVNVYAKKDANLTADDVAIKVGDVAAIIISINGDVAGNVTVNGENVSIVNGSAKYEIRDLAAGDYNFTVKFAGDKYFNADEKTILVVVSKLPAPEIVIDVADSAVEGSDLDVGITIEDATGIITINGENITLADGKASATIKNVTAGNLNIDVSYFGDDTYLNSTRTVVVGVYAMKDSGLDAVAKNVSVGEAVELNITINKDVTGKLTVDGIDLAITDGVAHFVLVNVPAGDYSYLVRFEGDKYFNPAEMTVNVTVSKIETPAGENPFDFDDNKTVESKTPTYSIKLAEDATGNLTVTVANRTYSAVLVNGSATVEVSDMPAGDYNVTVTYSGDDKYSPIVKTSKTSVKVDPRIVAKNATVEFSAGKYYSVTVYGNDGKVAADSEVTFILNGKVIEKVKTNSKGVAKFKVTQNPVSKGKLVINVLGISVTKTLTIKHVVTLKKETVKRSAKKDLVLTATLKVNGKALNGKKITFKFGSKFKKTVKTKNGVAKVTVSKSILNKLKAGNKITYTATYTKDSKKNLKDTVKRTVTVKK